MQFMIMMIPGVYRDNKTDKKFVPDPDKVQEMGRFNEELSKQVKLLSLNGLHPLSAGARVSFSKGKATVTDGRRTARGLRRSNQDIASGLAEQLTGSRQDGRAPGSDSPGVIWQSTWRLPLSSRGRFRLRSDHPIVGNHTVPG